MNRQYRSRSRLFIGIFFLCLLLIFVQGKTSVAHMLISPQSVPNQSKGFWLAVQELALALEEVGEATPIEVTAATESINLNRGDCLVVLELILEPSGSPREGPEAWRPWLGDGFRLRSEKHSSGATVVHVEGARPRAHLFGLFYLARLIRLEGAVPESLDVERRPAFVFRMASDCPAMALRMGFNMIPVEPHPAEVALLEEIKPPLFSGETKQAVLERRGRLQQALAEARDHHLETMAWGDEFQLPRAVLRPDLIPLVCPSDYDPEQAELGMGLGRIFCFARPKLWDLVRMKYKELFDDFPALSGAMVRLGENYAGLVGGHVVGNGVYAYGRPMYCAACRDLDYEERLTIAIQNLYRGIVRDSERLYVHRTWDLSDTLLHSNPEVFQQIFQDLPKDDRFIVSTKYTTSDFWRYNPPNPTLFVDSGRPRMVEVQCTREYEGKGAYPDYIGEEVQPILTDLAGRGVAGLWSWHHGGGQGGPSVSLDVWNQANVYLTSELAWNPKRSPEAIAHEWAALLVGPEAAKSMAKLLLLSDDGVLALRYFEAYSRERPGWTPANLWMRDDKIRGSRHLAKIYHEARGDVSALVREKDRAVGVVRKQQRLLEQARRTCRKPRIRAFCSDVFPSRRPAGRIEVASGHLKEAWISRNEWFEALDSSLEYQLSLARTLREYCAAYFYGRRWMEEGRDGDRRTARRALARWKAHWQDYNTRVAALPFAPSLYQDDGMVAAMDFIERILEQGRDPIFEWWTIGPFSNREKIGFASTYPPEQEIDLTKHYSGEGGAVHWFRFDPSLTYDGYHDLDARYAINDWVVAYAWTAFESPRAMDARLHLGSDDGIIAWFNGIRVVEADVYRAAEPEQHVVPVNIKPGRNEILLKVTEGILGWGFYFRLTDEQGGPIQTLDPSLR